MAAQTARKDHYVGETHRFLRDGFGVYSYGNKFFRYEGEWKKGRKHGHGKFIMADGSYYEGEFKEGEIEGYGFRYYASKGTSYTGQFHQGEPCGQGVFKYEDGTVYEGEFKDGKRSGYGTLKAPGTFSYEGFFHENKRHGEGAQTYTNGDRYDGDWINDKRQGHGELRQADGTIYDGQWRQDMMNGQGTMIHSSGCIYEGMWFNNRPACLSTKLIIFLDTPEIEEEGDFVIRVECHNNNGDLIEEDRGRELRLSAGFKWQPPKDPPPIKEGTALFDVIEDLEEKHICTPFGYEVVSYPLTDQLPGMSAEAETTPDTTQASETLPEEEREEGGTDDAIAESEDVKEESMSPRQTSPVTAEESTETLTGDGTTTAADTEEFKASVGTPLPPPVTNKRTEAGRCVWENLRLAPPPPMYRPFVMLDEAGRKSKTKVNPEKMTDKKPSETSVDDKGKAKKTADTPQYPRAGEYVIMVHDVTNPPFMGETLEPGFALLTIKQKKKPLQRRESRARWDTQQHIAQSTAGYERS
ncbi:MORN repeat-containing protein 1-like isoform X3 [Liolophura sinensis]|uniref:MORN repeat-containing protein 1-like isoform X3 n=1 Tax=Liolophura sinensis TaxID=3198878 RepID=UPI0031593D5D